MPRGAGVPLAPVFQLRRLRPDSRRTAPWVPWWKAMEGMPPQSPHTSPPPLRAAPVFGHMVPDSANRSPTWECGPLLLLFEVRPGLRVFLLCPSRDGFPVESPSVTCAGAAGPQGADPFLGLHVVAPLPGTGHERLQGWGVKQEGNRWGCE